MELRGEDSMTDFSGAPPGWPGSEPRWTSSAKNGVGTSLNPSSRVWFTLSHGIFNEIYYPRLDLACTRDMGMIITDGAGYFSEEKRHAASSISCLAEGVPAYRIENTCNQGRYRLVKEICADPARDVVLQKTLFDPLRGSLKDYHLHVLLTPHLGNRGSENTAWTGDYKGVPMLFARRNAFTLALACSSPWLKRSAGFVGVSDGWQDLTQNRKMTWTYMKAENGNVALTGEVDIVSCGGDFLLALGFGRNEFEAGNRALASILDGFGPARDKFVSEWTAWQKTLDMIAGEKTEGNNLYRISTAVLRTHEANNFPGGSIASLAIPWGFAKGDEDLGGYHIVWPRDLAEAGGGLLAAGAAEDVRRVLSYLQSTQESDGHWPQNMWLDGEQYWAGIQMDETAFPILLLDLARREGGLAAGDIQRFWPMVRKASGFIVCNGPVTQQDRWEEDPGLSPFTLAVEIAALLAAADISELNNEPDVALVLRETADAWNSAIERWVYVKDTGTAKKVGVEGYYVRIAPPEVAEASSPAGGFVPIKNRPAGQSSEPASQIVSPDALALVRFGLRAPDDPRILDTVKVIDAMLKVETPFGPAWHRYNDDGYGEHADGSPFDGTGIGRLWPLLTGERAHYELAAGRREEAKRLLKVMAAFANEGGLIPEQIWDSPDIPGRELFFGRPSGSAMPLVWAHAEYVKLLRSLRDGRVFDMQPNTTKRYVRDKTASPLVIWSFNHKCRTMAFGKTLRIGVLCRAVVRWSPDNWKTVNDVNTKDSGLGLHYVDLPTEGIPSGSGVSFTFYWPDTGNWEGKDSVVEVR
jgi:glucoamylase